MWYFCWVFGNFNPPALGLVFCHLACCVAFVFCHVTLLLCWFGLLSTCICSTISYVTLLFCFFFNFLVCEESIDFFRFFSFVFPFFCCMLAFMFGLPFGCKILENKSPIFCSLVCCNVLFGCGE